jgi:hypothetical protein
MRNRWGVQVHTLKIDQSHTSRSKKNDDSDSMLLVIWGLVRALLCAGMSSFYDHFGLLLCFSGTRVVIQ